MKKLKKYEWTESFFRKNIRFVDKAWILKKLTQADFDIKNKEKLQLNRTYTLYKSMFGVMIETGSLEIRKILMSDALDLMNRFVKIIPKRKSFTFQALQNSEGLNQTAEIFGLAPLDPKAVEGYILNHELVLFYLEPVSALVFKYKENPENIFLLYRFYFSLLQGELFLIIEKSI